MKRLRMSLLLAAVLLIGLVWGVSGPTLAKPLHITLASLHPLLVEIQQEVPVSITFDVPEGATAGDTVIVPAMLELHLRLRLSETGVTTVTVAAAEPASVTVYNTDGAPAAGTSSADAGEALTPEPGTPEAVQNQELGLRESWRQQGILAELNVETGAGKVYVNISFRNVTTEPKAIMFKAGEEIRVVDGEGEPVLFNDHSYSSKSEAARCDDGSSDSDLCLAPTCETVGEHLLAPGELATCVLAIEKWAVDPEGDVRFLVDLAEPDLEPFSWRTPAASLPFGAAPTPAPRSFW